MEKKQFKKMIDIAINREIEAYQFYSEVSQALAGRDKAISQIFSELAEQEKGHQNLLEELKQERDSHFKFSSPSNDYHLAEQTELPVLDLNMKPADAFVLAMKKEQQAVEFYRQMAANTTDPEITQMCNSLTNMELQHKRTIENAYVDVAYPESF